MYSTLKRRGNECFHLVSTWNTRGVIVKRVDQRRIQNPIKRIRWRLLADNYFYKNKSSFFASDTSNKISFREVAFLSDKKKRSYAYISHGNQHLGFSEKKLPIETIILVTRFFTFLKSLYLLHKLDCEFIYMETFICSKDAYRLYED